MTIDTQDPRVREILQAAFDGKLSVRETADKLRELAEGEET